VSSLERISEADGAILVLRTHMPVILQGRCRKL
jgi:hypothetical protein